MKKINELGLEITEEGRVFSNEKNLQKVKSLLDNKSCSLCLAKFTQVTLHLGAGLVHSCHHPRAHKIPLEELENNPAALFNTNMLKNARKEMLTGIRPKECDYCWRIEDNKNNSDRHYKSSEDWAIHRYNDVINSTGDEFIKPTYLEVSFGNACNLTCSYCGPEFSSKWIEDLKSNGPLKVTDGVGHEQWVQGWQDLDSLVIPNKDFNPYIDAFWKWFPEIYPQLKHYRITGGEPLLNKNTLKSLDYIISNPREDLELSINTNLAVPQKLWEEFLNRIVKLEQLNFKKITIFTSFESWDNRAEYSRHGMDFNLVKSRFEELLQKTGVRCVLMATYNMLAVTSFKLVLEWMLNLKKSYNYNHKRDFIYKDTGYDIRINQVKNNKNNFRVGIDTPYLRHPECLDVQYCSDELLLNYMIPCLEFMIRNTTSSEYNNHMCFEPHETSKFERVIYNRLNYKQDTNASKINIHRAKFFDYITELDRRRNTDFLNTFPEMSDFYHICKEERNKLK